MNTYDIINNDKQFCIQELKNMMESNNKLLDMNVDVQIDKIERYIKSFKQYQLILIENKMNFNLIQ